MATATRVRPAPVRGGVSLSAVLTGVVVAFGAIFLLSALLGGILTAAGVDAADVEPTENIGIGIGIAFVLLQLLAFLWGGYTAGRMGRGAGLLNGLLVPLGALLVSALVAAAVAALGAVANLNLPFTTSRLPAQEETYLVDWGPLLGLIALAAAFLGGIAGGVFGARWHNRLEREAAPAPAVERDETIRLDERERSATRPTTGGAAATSEPTTGGAAATSEPTTGGAAAAPPPPPDDETATPPETARRREP